MRDADHVIQMVQAHASYHVARIVGYTLIAWGVDEGGHLYSHTLLPEGQPPNATGEMLTGVGDIVGD